MELETLESGGFQDGFDGDFGLISKSLLLAKSYRFLIVWQELVRIRIILEIILVPKKGSVCVNWTVWEFTHNLQAFHWAPELAMVTS